MSTTTTPQRCFARFSTTTRLDVPEIGQWIEVREEISIGEQRRIFSGAVKGQTSTGDGQRMEYDAERVSFGLVVAYLVDWSLTDEDGKSVEVTEDAIKALLPSAYDAIEAVVNAHVDEVEAKKTPRRSAKRGAPTSSSRK